MRLFWFHIRRAVEDFGRRHPAASAICLVSGLFVLFSVAVSSPLILQDLLAGDITLGGFLLGSGLLALLTTAYIAFYYSFQEGAFSATGKAFSALAKTFGPSARWTMRWIVDNLVLPKGRN